MEIEATVRGRVQMVMYRDFTQRKARNLGLVGYVKNNNDGSVTVVAKGEQKLINELIKFLHKGPLFAKVEGVSIKEITPKEIFKTFDIRYSSR